MAKTAEVERDGARVTIRVECGEVYEAMALYDELNAIAAAPVVMLVTELTSLGHLDLAARRRSWLRARREGEKRARR